MRLSPKVSAHLPANAFAGPGRTYPVNDKAHARAAIMLSGHAPAAARARIIARAKAVLAK